MKKKLKKRFTFALALMMMVVSIFTGIGTAGLTEVQAAEEPAGRGTSWDILYSEILAKGSGKEYQVGTKIYIDEYPVDADASHNFFMNTLETAVKKGYASATGTIDENYGNCYKTQVLKIGEIVTLEDSYTGYNSKLSESSTIKSGGYWVFNRAATKYDTNEFYGVIASSEEDQYKDVKISTGSSSGGSSGGSSTPSENQTITELEVNIDWTKVPSLTVGTGVSGSDLPTMPESVCQTNSAQANYVECGWAVQATQDHVDSGYLDQNVFDTFAVYNHLMPVTRLKSNYEISANDTYYYFVFLKANDGYKFGDSAGVNVTSILKSNVSDMFALTDYNGNGVLAFFKLGTPAEIAKNNGSSSGGSSTPSENQTIKELDVNIDWSKVPELTVGTKVGTDATNLPSVNDIVTSNSTQVEILNCKWAVKATQEHVNNNYLSIIHYEEAAKYNHLVEINVFDKDYAISADETYYGYAAFAANAGYQFKNGEDITSLLKSNINISDCFATTTEDGTLAYVFFKLGTPAEIAEKKGSSTGGNTPGGNTPGGNTPGGNTPGGNTPGGNTPGGNTPGGEEPKNNTTTDVVVSADTPVGSVAGLEKIFETIAAEDNKGYTAADQAVVAAGGSAKIYLDAKLVTSETTGSKAATEELTKAGYQSAIALDLSVIKEIVTTAGDKTTTKLIELPALISVVSDIPEAYQGKSDYCIYRNHEGAVDILTTTPNADGEYIELSADGKQLILHIKKFSEYVLGYKESTTSSTPSTPANSTTSTNQTASANSSASTNQTAASTTQDTQTTAAQDAQTAATTATSPKTGEDTSMALFVMIFALAGLGMVVVYKKAKRA